MRNRIPFMLAAILLIAVGVSHAAQNLSLPEVEGDPIVVTLTVGIEVQDHGFLSASYQGGIVDVVPLAPENDEVVLQVARCYADGEPSAPLSLEASAIDGTVLPFTLLADKDRGGPVRQTLSLAMPVMPAADAAPAVATEEPEVPAGPSFTVSPNPFNPSVKIAFRGEVGDFALVNVYDLRGRLTRGLYSGPVRLAETELVWDGRGDDGRGLPSGVYFVHLFVGGHEEVKKVMLAK